MVAQVAMSDFEHPTLRYSLQQSFYSKSKLGPLTSTLTRHALGAADRHRSGNDVRDRRLDVLSETGSECFKLTKDKNSLVNLSVRTGSGGDLGSKLIMSLEEEKLHRRRKRA
ncbi:hypothetical protein EVAR_68337_1 [Eumeta japonica]|uniref:Uncharacterized protein n=1 Tax=Eumeta variegata TaxID=151549 RepID=A0A4C2A3U8_EUMVA|nr:hypothetical protein EVAR_68337_1 [Eumeta japonica]